MRSNNHWEDYELIDASCGERLERWGDVVLIRPDPQVIWKTPKKAPEWNNANARYHRSEKGGGAWDVYKKYPERWTIKYDDLAFYIKPMGFKHTGLFPEQATNWDYLRRVIKKSQRDVKVLNLFAYTGGATCASLAENASVCHVDASKGMVSYAKENVELCGFSDRKVRYIVDDCEKFVSREIRRGNKYDILIMDPPSYGRGPKGEIWKLEDKVYELVELCSNVMSDEPLMFLINSYTTGLSASVMEYILGSVMIKKYGGKVSSDEIGLKVKTNDFSLPAGASAIWIKD